VPKVPVLRNFQANELSGRLTYSNSADDSAPRAVQEGKIVNKYEPIKASMAVIRMTNRLNLKSAVAQNFFAVRIGDFTRRGAHRKITSTWHGYSFRALRAGAYDIWDRWRRAKTLRPLHG
jgi:hypothetical protein